jgi:hypothetical protein
VTWDNPNEVAKRHAFGADAVAWAMTALLLPAVAGCAHLTSEVGHPLPAKPASLHVAQSHLQDVLRTVGPPSRVSEASPGFALLYEYNGVEEIQLGFSINVAVLRFFKFVGAKSWLEHQAWLMVFDEKGVLQAWGEEHWRRTLGRGAAAQFLVTVSSLVDSSQVRRPSPQHSWGKSLLAPLPRSLNYTHSPDNPSAAMEQTLAPTAVGQRALEMTPPPRRFPKKK